uniref:Uncharacterized protein n=1 Tax=Oscillatoriales cyanobacterium SpSt-402 TaxID=2282168 RepID=A0A832H533_9CYAN
MMLQSGSTTLTVQVSTISRCDRWQASQRLQELSIPCTCSTDGQLHVEINHPIDVLQLKSVIEQLTATRPDLIHWLERCWQIPGTSSPNH